VYCGEYGEGIASLALLGSWASEDHGIAVKGRKESQGKDRQ
jgi:hypothetical protein